jgi:hypothetical protein
MYIKMSITKFISCISFCLSVLVAKSQTTYDVFTYTEPKGYKKETKTGFTSYTKSDAKTGTYCIISLYAQSPSSGDLAKDFDNDWKELVATSLGVTAAPEKDNGDEITGWKTYSGGANFDFGGGTSMALLTTAKKDNANVAILIVTNSQSFLTTDVDAFFAKLKLGKPKVQVTNTNQNANTSQPAVTNTSSTFNLLNGSGIAGVWVIYSKPGITQNLQWNWFVFFNNGKSLQNMPSGGFYNLPKGSYYNVSRNTPEYWPVGTYSFANGIGKNKKRDEVSYQETLQLIKPNQLSINGTNYFKCVNVNGLKLNGSFTSYANPNDPQLNTLPYGEKPKITFYTDGKFKDEGLFNTYLFDGATNPNAAKPGNGTYELRDYSIILKYDDGRVRQEAFTIPFSNNPIDATIIFISRSQINKIN